jgi:hypothetical protein
MGFEPGPMFREILTALEEAQLDGRLSSREEALAWIRERYAAETARSDERQVVDHVFRAGGLVSPEARNT